MVTTIEDEEEKTPWYKNIWDFIERGEYPEGSSEKDKRAIRRFTAQFIIYGGMLLKRSYKGYNLICLSGNDARRMMEEIHEGVCSPHMDGHMLAKKIIRQGYYWTTLEKDCCEYVRKCHKCQIHANMIYVPPSLLYSMTSPWSFSTWGIDIIGEVIRKL